MGKQSIQWLYLNNSTRARIAKLQALEFVAFPNSAKVFPCFPDPPPTFSNFFLHALPKSISEKLLLTSFQSSFSFLSASPARFLPVPLLLYSLLRDVFIPNHHHGKVVVSLAMRSCEPLKKPAPHSSKIPPTLAGWYENTPWSKRGLQWYLLIWMIWFF